jgi:hypothetical protein
LASGNRSAAQSDFATLQQNLPQNLSSSESSSSTSTQNPVAKAFQQLSQDLKSGNLSAAQQDCSTIQQDFQNQSAAGQAIPGHHHHHHNNVSNSESSTLNQLFSEVGARNPAT